MTRAQAARVASAIESGKAVEHTQHVKTCFDFASKLRFTIPAARKWMDQLEECSGMPPKSPTSLSEVVTPSYEAASDADNMFSATQLRQRLAEVRTSPAVSPALSLHETGSAINESVFLFAMSRVRLSFPYARAAHIRAAVQRRSL